MTEFVKYASPNLDDPSLFWLRPAVPILDCHIRSYPPRPDGSVRAPEVFEVARLRRVASISNARAAAGDFAVLRLGHIQYRPDVPETEQPEPIGYARNFRVATLVDDAGRNIKPGSHLVADFHFQASIPKSKVESFPHRSVELNVGEDFIDGVSLLRRPPERSLGILTYARRSEGGSNPAVGREDDEARLARQRSVVESLIRRGADMSDDAARSLEDLPREVFMRAVRSHESGLVRSNGRQRMLTLATKLSGTGIPPREALERAKMELGLK